MDFDRQITRVLNQVASNASEIEADAGGWGKSAMDKLGASLLSELAFEIARCSFEILPRLASI